MGVDSLLPWNWFRSQPRRTADPGATLKAAVQSLMARYDSAQTTDDNSRHWSMADGMSANTANSHAVRATLRNRSRYECGNNCYARGIVQTIANHTIGSGPRLQLRTGNKQADKSIKKSLKKWFKEVRLPEKLRTLVQARVGDGEGFGVKVYNPKLKHAVKLDLRLFEAEMCTSQYNSTIDEKKVDGVDFDDFGNVKQFWILKDHPGGLGTLGNSWNPIAHSPENVIHLFKATRAGQARGIPEITPALPLFAQLRRYTLAVIAAAEIAALISVYLKTTGQVAHSEVTPWIDFDLQRNAGMVLPDGWDMGQFKAEQPITTYSEFKTEVLNEIARCVDMPLNIAACNSNNASFSSGKLDHLTYGNSIAIDRQQIEDVVLDSLLLSWLEEAMLIPGLIPEGLPPISEWEWEWQWDAMKVGDPLKEEAAIDLRLRNGTSSVPHELEEQGYDWEAIIEAQAEFFEVTPAEVKKAIFNSLYSDGMKVAADHLANDANSTLAEQAARSIKDKFSKSGMSKKQSAA